MGEAPTSPREDALAAPIELDEARLDPRARRMIAGLRAERDAARGEAEALREQLDVVRRLADRDALIPVLNRRAFVRELHRAAAFCARYGGPAALIYMDLDAFKGVNDRFGHAAGDAALAAVADVLVSNVRESDIVGRLGGDEFGVILVKADAAAAELKAQGLIERLRAAPLVFEGRSISLSASAGVRIWEPGLQAAQWLAEADAAMFLRKGAGSIAGG